MSSLKYQLRELLPSLSEQGKTCKNKEIKARLYLIKGIVSSERTIKAACDFRGVCRDTFYRWTRRLIKQKKIEALADISQRPKNSPMKTSQRIERKIRVIRKGAPFMGPDRISNALKKHHMECPASTVYAVLKRNKLISKEENRRRTKKHMKRYRQPVPGFLQMDFKYVPYKIEEKQYYQLSAIDHCSSWRFIRAYQNKGEAEVLEFLQALRKECPFAIFEIQTDNDAAFTDKYTSGMGLRPSGVHVMDQWCTKYGIRHKLIPIGEKELNGKVENSHKFDDQEFFSQYEMKNYMELQTRTYTHNDYWNYHRPTKTLGWKTPDRVIEGYQLTFLFIELWFKSLTEPLKEPKQASLPKVLPALKTKKLSKFNRYLAWMDWEGKNYPKIVSWMSLSYSMGSFNGIFQWDLSFTRRWARISLRQIPVSESNLPF